MHIEKSSDTAERIILTFQEALRCNRVGGGIPPATSGFKALSRDICSRQQRFGYKTPNRFGPSLVG